MKTDQTATKPCPNQKYTNKTWVTGSARGKGGSHSRFGCVCATCEVDLSRVSFCEFVLLWLVFCFLSFYFASFLSTLLAAIWCPERTQCFWLFLYFNIYLRRVAFFFHPLFVFSLGSALRFLTPSESSFSFGSVISCLLFPASDFHDCFTRPKQVDASHQGFRRRKMHRPPPSLAHNHRSPFTMTLRASQGVLDLHSRFASQQTISMTNVVHRC